MGEIDTSDNFYKDLVQILSQLSKVESKRILPESHLYCDLKLDDDFTVLEVLDIVETRYQHNGFNGDNVKMKNLRTVGDFYREIVRVMDSGSRR